MILIRIKYYAQARIKTLLGQKESALDDLEKAMEGKAFGMPVVKTDPVFDPLRFESRFQEILRKMRLE